MAATANIEEGSTFTPQFEKRNGLLPVVVQEYETNEILMLGYANETALHKTISSGLATFWSTSRNTLWTKGMTSGDTLRIQEILADCDQDALIYKVVMEGAGSCHTKDKSGNQRKSCFYRKIASEGDKLTFLPERE